MFTERQTLQDPNRITTPSKRHWLDVVLLIFTCTFSLVEMRSFDLRISNMHCDDGPIFYALAFKDRALFAGDIQGGSPIDVRVNFKVISSAQNWIPALAW